MKKLFIPILFVFVGNLFFVSPALAAVNNDYVPQTTLEYIAYLQGVVDALKAQSLQSGNSNVVVSTPSIASTVTLEAELESRLGTSAYAWFEYGLGDLDSKTTRTRVTKKSSDDTYEHRQVIKNLESGTYSYRAVFESRNGKKYYGNVNTFTVGEASGYYPNVGGTYTSGNSTRGSITLNNTSASVGEYIFVDWSVPERKADNDNWIGLFKKSDDNDEYVSWRSLSDDTSGTARFYLRERGTYEFRLFYDSGYDDEVTSRTLNVSR